MHWLPAQVDIIFELYGEEDREHQHNLAYKELLHAMEKREGNMLLTKQQVVESGPGDSLFGCLRACF